MLEYIIKVFQLDYIIFIYTPTHIVLACTDLTLNEMSESGGELSNVQSDLTQYFPDIDMKIWDKVGTIKETIKKY